MASGRGGRAGFSSASAPSIEVTQRVPSAALPTTTAGITSSPRRAGQERQRTEGDRAGARDADGVVALDRSEDAEHLRDAAAHRDPSAGQADAVAHEQVAVAAGHAVEVDVALEAAGDRLHDASSADRRGVVIRGRPTGCP